MAWCACTGCDSCTRYEGGPCHQNISKLEKKWTPLGSQMCAYCAENRQLSQASSARGSATEQPFRAPQPHVGTQPISTRARAANLHSSSASPQPELEQQPVYLHGPSSSSQSPLEQRVGTLETLIQTLEQSLSQVLEKNIDLRDSVVRLQQELEQALERVEELERIMDTWQQWPEWQ